MGGTRTKAVCRLAVALGTALAMLAFAVPALANAPNPETTTVNHVTVNPDGSTTVTISGTWTWQTQTKCPSARNGVGYQIDWFDNTTNAIGTANDPNGILYVGTAKDNIVHSDESLGQSTANDNAFWDGVPQSYVNHHLSSTTPTSTDAANWFGDCSGLNSSGVTAGTWGPITHTYAANFPGPIKFCPIMYDPHGGSQNSGKSSVKDITAGGNASSKGYNNDNSYQTNQTGPGPGFCKTVSIPQITTQATPSSGTVGQSFNDAATLSHSSGSGTITWKVYPAGSGCSGTPLFTTSKTVSGDGTFTSPADSNGNQFTPGSPGTYQWQASYSSSTIRNLITNCSDSSEQVTVTTKPAPDMAVLKLASVRCADLASSVTQPLGLTAASCASTYGTWSPFSHDTWTVQVPAPGKTYAIPIDYQIQVQNTGNTPLQLSLSDPRCDAGTISQPVAVSGQLVGNTLSAGGAAYFTCSHTLTQSDPDLNVAGQPFTNTATVFGKVPGGPTIHRSSQVTVERHLAVILPFCRAKRGRRKGQKIHYRRGHFPRACLKPRPKPKPSKPPRHSTGFTG